MKVLPSSGTRERALRWVVRRALGCASSSDLETLCLGNLRLNAFSYLGVDSRSSIDPPRPGTFLPAFQRSIPPHPTSALRLRRYGSLSYSQTMTRPLPHELLLKIHRHALPPLGTSSTHARFLISFALVCRTWSEAALEILHDSVEIFTSVDAASFIRACESGRRTRLVDVRGGTWVPHMARGNVVNGEELEAVLSVVKGLRVLKISGLGRGPAELSAILSAETLADLTTLELSLDLPRTTSRCITLPFHASLTSLAIAPCNTYDERFLRLLLTPTLLSLRILPAVYYDVLEAILESTTRIYSEMDIIGLRSIVVMKESLNRSEVKCCGLFFEEAKRWRGLHGRTLSTRLD